MTQYALNSSTIQRLKREAWGAKISLPDGTKKDTGVQPLVDELIASLSNQAPIDLTQSFAMNAPAGQGQPAIVINRTIAPTPQAVSVYNTIGGANIVNNVSNTTTDQTGPSNSNTAAPDGTGGPDATLDNGFIRFVDQYKNIIEFPGQGGTLLNINGRRLFPFSTLELLAVSGTSTIAYGQSSTITLAGGFATFTLFTGAQGSEVASTFPTVSAYVRQGVCFTGKTYKLIQNLVGNAVTYEVADPDLTARAQCSGLTIGNASATFTLYTGGLGSESATTTTLSAFIPTGIVYASKTYGIICTDNGNWKSDYDRRIVVKNLTGSDISKGSSGTVTIMTGSQGSETSSGTTITALPRWGTFKNNAIGFVVLDDHITGAPKWTVDSTDTC